MTMTCDHPGWIATDTAHRRIAASTSGNWLACWDDTGLTLDLLDGTDAVKPSTTGAARTDLAGKVAPELADALSDLGQVVRVANPSLWDALTVAILRQVVRAPQARALYRRWCASHGTAYTTPTSTLSGCPSPAKVLSLADEQFAEVGAKFHRTALQAAAAAYQQDGAVWAALPAAELAEALTGIRRIGPWTAKAAACDFTGDFSVYPHSDLAVRTWASRAAPALDLPDEDRAFEAAWRAMADTDQQLHALTLLTLTWGSHARYRPGPGADLRS